MRPYTAVQSAGGTAVAIDLPGYGGTKTTEGFDEAEKGALVAAAAAHFKLDKAVLVAASMSGGWAFPFIRDNPTVKWCKLTVYG